MRTIVVSGLLAVLAGCDGGGSPQAGAPAVSRLASSESGWGLVSVRLTLDRDRVTTAERVTMTLEVEAPAGAGATMPALRAEFGGFTVVEQRVEAARLTPGGGMLTSAVWVLEPFLPGEYAIPPIEVMFTGVDGGTGIVTTELVAVVVGSVLGEGEGETAEIGPARDVVGPPLPRDRGAAVRALGLAGVGVVAILGATGMVWAVRRRQRTVPDVCRLAERRLAELQALSMTGERGARAAVEEASSLVRHCLAARLEPAAEMRTTEELLGSRLLTLNLSEGDMSVLRAALRTADGAKFGGAEVSGAQAGAMVGGMLGLVRMLSTMVVVMPLDDGAAAAAPGAGGAGA